MAVFRIEKISDCTVIANHHLRNTALSLNGTITVPAGITDREVQYFISHGIISAAEYNADVDATESMIYRILNASVDSVHDFVY